MYKENFTPEKVAFREKQEVSDELSIYMLNLL